MKFQNLVGLTMNIKFINIWEQKPPDMTICDQNIIFASGHVVYHEPTCRPGTKTEYGGGGELDNLGKFIE